MQTQKTDGASGEVVSSIDTGDIREMFAEYAAAESDGAGNLAQSDDNPVRKDAYDVNPDDIETYEPSYAKSMPSVAVMTKADRQIVQPLLEDDD